MSSANVTSIDALKDLREAVATFVDDAKNALVATDMENRRALDWLNNNQRLYWTEELKRRREKLAMAQSNLHKKKLAARPGSAIKDADEKEAVRAATAKVREAEMKVELVRKWGPPLQHAIDEYLGKARPLNDMIEQDVRRMIMMLDRMVVALEEYTRLSAPSS